MNSLKFPLALGLVILSTDIAAVATTALLIPLEIKLQLELYWTQQAATAAVNGKF
jgi:hypothetical protein